MGAPVLDDLGDGLFRVERVLDSGWGLNMVLVRLPGGGVLVHSPTWLGPATFDVVGHVGTPAALLAPNHFHHLSLARYRARYPDAMVVATDQAAKRLARRGHAPLGTLESLAPFLPDGARLLVPDGTANGEVFLSLPGPGDGRTWVVCDAFFNVQRPITGIVQPTAFRLLRLVPGPSVGRTWGWVGLRGNGSAYRSWFLDTFEREKPTRVVVSHGEPIVGERVAELARLVAAS